MLKITSRENQRIIRARKVRDGFVQDAVFVEGARLAEEVLRSNLKISDVFFTENFAASERGQRFLSQIEFSNRAQIPDKIFDSLSDTKSSQGVILIGEKPAADKSFIEAKLSENKKFKLVVLLHQTNNPTNLGAILRTCEAANVAGVILTKNSADAFSPKALRGAMGASFRLPIWTEADFFEVLNWAKEKNLTSICADVKAEKSYLDVDWRKAHLLIFGSEAHGLSQKERAKVADNLIIPMENAVESLNLAVSAGVILFEAKRQIDR